MEKKLTDNLWLKILSVFLAFFVWLAVVNISKPETSDYREVPLEVINGDVLEANGKTYELLNDKNTVTISYNVRSLNTSSIRPTDFRAYVDLAEMYEPTGAVQVKVEVKNNKNLLIGNPLAKPGVIRVETEDLQRKLFELSAHPDGKQEDGYSIGTPAISPTYVYVSGPMSLVGQISTAGISIDVDGADSDLSGSAEVKCYDANDHVLPLGDRVTFSRSEVDYTLPILKIKNLGLNFETEGKVADGYRFTGIESNKNSVEVKGLKSDLAGVSNIVIPKSMLNMDGASGDKEVTIDLNQYLPEGAELADPSSNIIRVVIKVEALENRTYTLPVSDIKQVGASGQLAYSYDRDSVSVVVKGLKEDLDQLNASNMGAEMDVGSMLPGVSEGEISFQLGAAYELVSYDHPRVTVAEKLPSPSAEEDSKVDEGKTSEEDTQEASAVKETTKAEATKQETVRQETSKADTGKPGAAAQEAQ